MAYMNDLNIISRIAFSLSGKFVVLFKKLHIRIEKLAVMWYTVYNYTLGGVYVEE